MNKTVKNRRIDTIFVLIVFGIFAFSVLMVLMLGASIYRNMSEMSQEGQSERMVLSYIRTKVKNYDGADRVHVGDFSDIPALTIDEKLGDNVYQTLIYHHSGWLYELFTETPHYFVPEDGMSIARIDEVTFTEEPGGRYIRIAIGDFDMFMVPRGRFNEPMKGMDFYE
jgi:hypothetical protein